MNKKNHRFFLMTYVFCQLFLLAPLSQAQDAIFLEMPLSPEHELRTEEGSNLLDLGLGSLKWRQACQVLADLDEALDALVLAYEPRYQTLIKAERAFERLLLEDTYRKDADDERSASAQRRFEEEKLKLEEEVLKEPTLCADLDEDIKVFIMRHEAELLTAIQSFVEIAEREDEALAKQWLGVLKQMRNANARRHAKAQKILYHCIARNKSLTGAVRKYSVERSMRRWFLLQKPMVDAWLGNTD